MCLFFVESLVNWDIRNYTKKNILETLEVRMNVAECENSLSLQQLTCFCNCGPLMTRMEM